MNAYSVGDLKQDLTGMLHGTNLNQITGLDAAINRAARDVLLDVDPQETAKTVQIGQVFNSIYDYACPSDLKGNRFIDIYPQVNRGPNDIFPLHYSQDFDVSKQTSLSDQATIVISNFLKRIRISAPLFPAPVVVNDCSALNSSGLWSAVPNAQNLTADNVNFVAQNGALKFDIAAGGATGALVNSTIPALDLSSLLDQGYLFLWTYLPTAADFTSVTLRWGTSSTAYYQVAATVTQEGTVFQDGWNLLAFPWLGATVVGVPDPTSISYLEVIWAYNGSLQTAVRLDQITAILGQILNMDYYSRFMFRDFSTGAFQETVTDDTNLINLDTEAVGLMLYKVAPHVVQQQQGLDAVFYDAGYFQGLYQEQLHRYKELYKSQVQKAQTTYYAMPKPGQFQMPRTRRGF